MPSPILARADALMQRRRQNAEIDDVPVLTDAVDLDASAADDDVPVLLDIEAIEPLAPPLPEIAQLEQPATGCEPLIAPIEASDAPEPALDATAIPDLSLPTLTREIARRVEQRLAAELPRLIAETVRDFLAERGIETSDQPDQPD